MEKWNFKVKSSPQEIINKLNTTLKSVNGFVFKIDHNTNDSVRFNMRKRVHYPDQIFHRNRIIINGKILNTDNTNETEVEISFTQHLIMTLQIAIVFISVLFVVTLTIYSGASMYIPAGIALAVGILLWIALHKKSKKDIQNYKTLISEILEFKKG